jgi:amino acid transporter
VARDLLVGALAGVVTVLVGQVTILIPSFFGASALSPHPSLLQPLGEAREVAWFLVFHVWFAVMASIAALCFLLILRVALRRDVLAFLALLLFAVAYIFSVAGRSENLLLETA